MKEKLTVRIGEQGLVIVRNEIDGDKTLVLTASEALMLLDILKNEAGHLEELAQKASPIPVKFNIPSR